MLILKDILSIENNPEILNFKFTYDNVLMWPFIRIKLHRIPLFKEYKLANPFAPIAKLGLSDISYLKNTFIHRPYKNSLKRDFDILMFCSGITNIKKGNKYFNRVSDYFAFINKDKTLLIEESARRIFYTPRYFPNICYHDFTILKAFIKSKFVKVKREDFATIKSLIKFLKENFPYKLEKLDLIKIENTLLSISKRLNINHYLYNKLFDKFCPKVVFLQGASYGRRSYIVKWAKSRNIFTVEPQHGLISKNHEAYNYGEAIVNSNIYKNYLPDYFLTYGKYWADSINLPVKKVIIGNPNYSENKKNINFRMQNKTRTKILITSGGTNPNIMKKIALDISTIVDHDKYEITFRPHPQEIPMIKDRYSELIKKRNIKINTDTDLFLDLSNADYLAGDYSTVLFEAIGFCKSVFAIEHPATDLHVPRNIIKRFSNAEELITLIQDHKFENRINQDYIWELNWEAKYKKFINNLLCYKS